jgi:uncharacterized repeat protein (TIGR03803 family)
LILSGNTLYGTTVYGGSSSKGTVFAVNTDGTRFTNLHSFTALGTDGSHPQAGLILSGNILYGTTYGGGSTYGIVFAINADGTGFINLHSFTGGDDGRNPVAALALSGNTLYGTTYLGGSSDNGTVFAVNTDGTGFTNLHSFTGGSGGARPSACLTLSGNTLYGTTQFGNLFKLSSFGSGFTNLHNFGAFPDDGSSSRAGLLLSGSTLYGTASLGGSSSGGTVFAVNTDGTGYTNLHNLTETNGDGGAPYAELILSNNILYGTTFEGGISGHGTVFSLSFEPQLSIIPSGANVILAWPTNFVGFDYTGYTLQSTTNLASPVWAANSPEPVIVNGQYTVTNSISITQQFFRLRE